jgi:hypothetical protein
MVRLFPYNLKQASVISVLGCVIVAGIAAIDSPRAGNDQSVAVSVNRTNKGDRLASVAKPAALLPGSSPTTKLSAPPKGPPLGCDPLFSTISDPAKARLFYRRCTV